MNLPFTRKNEEKHDTDKPFDWKRIFRIKKYDEYEEGELEVDKTTYERRAYILERVLNYKFADTNGDGKVDSEENQKIIENLKIKMQLNQDEIIDITIKHDPENGTHKGTRNISGDYINIDFHELKHHTGFIDPKTGIVSPAALNTVVYHEIDHLYDKENSQLYKDTLNSIMKIPIKKETDRQDIYNIRKELINKLHEKEKIYSRHKNEMESIEAERSIAEKHGEPTRSIYTAVTTLTGDNILEEPIYYTSDEDRYNHTSTQRISEAEIRNIYTKTANNPRFSDADRKAFLKEIKDLHKHFKRNNLYSSTENFPNIEESELANHIRHINNSSKELGTWEYYEKAKDTLFRKEPYSLIQEAKDLAPQNVEIKTHNSTEDSNKHDNNLRPPQNHAPIPNNNTPRL